MTERVKDGGPAFPSFADTEAGHQMKEYGMSLRDWFAGRALPGLIASLNHPTDTVRGDSSEHPRDTLAKRAYAIADAMLKARNG